MAGLWRWGEEAAGPLSRYRDRLRSRMVRAKRASAWSRSAWPLDGPDSGAAAIGRGSAKRGGAGAWLRRATWRILRRWTAGTPRKVLIRSINCGARCCSSSAAQERQATSKAPTRSAPRRSRRSLTGWQSPASSAPTAARQSKSKAASSGGRPRSNGFIKGRTALPSGLSPLPRLCCLSSCRAIGALLTLG